jgi:hypothetical protein
MGMLSASVDSDLMDASSWTKATEPVFVTNEATEQYGPGHSTFTVSEDGLSDLLVYHDRGYRDIDGEPLNDRNRRTRVQKVYWDANGPVLGVPVPDGMTPVRLRTATDESLFVRHQGEDASVELSGSAPLVETQFRVAVQGDADAVVIETTSAPGRYLVRDGSALLVGGDGEKTEFVQVPGVSDEAGVSFVVKDEETLYVVIGEDGEVGIGEVADKSRATFYLE